MSACVPALLDDMAERKRYLAAPVEVVSEEVPRLSAHHALEASCVRVHIARVTQDALNAAQDARSLEECLRGVLAAVAALRAEQRDMRSFRRAVQLRRRTRSRRDR